MEQFVQKDEEISAADSENSEQQSLSIEEGKYGKTEAISKCRMSFGKNPNSFFCILDEKNRTIEHLKRQLHNQKIQLGHYLHSALSTPKILELAENCIPQVTEENIQLTLAMNNFYKQNGLKSKMMNIHDRMVTIDTRICDMLERQETLIRNIIETLMKFASSSYKASNSLDEDQNILQLQLLHFFNNFAEFEIFQEILTTTINLRKELDTFRVCCNRLITIEDERNTLVEQVYSTPIEQRMNSNYIIGIQLEKRQLEIEIEDIRNQQKLLENKIRNLNKAEECLKDLQSTGITPDETTIGIQLRNVLDIINSDAETILNTSQEQKRKFAIEMEKLMRENKWLRDKNEILQTISYNKENMEARLQQLENEYTVVIEDLQKSKEFEISKRNETIKNLKKENEYLIKESNCLRDKVNIFSDIVVEVENLRSEQEEFYAVRLERDELKIQVENLQSIRAAYAQMVEHHYKDNKTKCDWSQLELEKEKSKEAEIHNEMLVSKIATLSNTISSQERQIKQLLSVIEKSRADHERYNICNVEGENKSKTSTSVTKTASNEMKSEQINSQNATMQNSNFTQKSFIGSAGDTTYDKRPMKMICLDDNPLFNNSKIQSNVIENTLQSNSASFEIFSTDTNGNVESIKAILECSSPVEGFIKMEKLPNISLKVKCAPVRATEKDIELKPESGDKTVKTHVFDSAPNINETELMRDCSKESLVITCPPCKSSAISPRENFNITQIRHTETFNILKNAKDLETLMPVFMDKSLDATTSTKDFESGFSSELISVDLNTSGLECKIKSHEEYYYNRIEYEDKIKIVEAEINKTLVEPDDNRLVGGSMKSLCEQQFNEKESEVE